MRAPWYLAAVALVCGCAARAKRSRAPGEEYLRDIEIRGNRALASKTLIAGLALRRTRERGWPPDPYLVEVDADRIRGQYLREGFLAVDVRPRVERAGDAATVIYDVEEGTRATTRVSITGLPADADLPRAKVRSKLALRDGEPFDYATYDAAKEELLRMVQDAGYAHAKLDATVYADRARSEAVISLAYTPGPKSRFGEVTITGTSSGELADAVRGRLRFAEGETYSTSKLAATQQALYALGRFSTVQVQTAETTSPIVPITITVAESAPRSIELGGGLGMDPLAYEVRGRAGYSIAGWPTPLMTSRIELRPAYAIMRETGDNQPRIRALARLERQDLLWTYAKGDVEVGYNYLAQLGFTSYGPRARLGFSTPIVTERLQLRVGWGIERLDFRDISPALEPLRIDLGLDHSQRVGSYTQAVSIDLRDHPIEPTRGIYAEGRIAEGTRAAGSAFDFFSVVPEVRGFLPIPLGRGIVLAGRVRVGAIYGDLPISERLFSGGASNHRGFGERQLAPFVIENDGTEIPYGGAALFETGVEARIRLWRVREMPLSGVVFLDGGDVTERVSELAIDHLHWAAGIGARIHTIVGPVRADVGYRLTRTGPLDPEPGSRFAFHLSLGEAF